MINSLVPIKHDALDKSSAAPSSDYNGNYELLGKWTILSVRRYFKITRKRFAIDDTKMLVWCIDNRTISSRYRDIEVFEQCFHIDGCLSIEWDDTPECGSYDISPKYRLIIRYIEYRTSTSKKWCTTNIFCRKWNVIMHYQYITLWNLIYIVCNTTLKLYQWIYNWVIFKMASNIEPTQNRRRVKAKM